AVSRVKEVKRGQGAVWSDAKRGSDAQNVRAAAVGRSVKIAIRTFNQGAVRIEAIGGIERVEAGERSIRSDLEHAAFVAQTARVGNTVKVSVLSLDKGGKGAGAIGPVEGI